MDFREDVISRLATIETKINGLAADRLEDVGRISSLEKRIGPLELWRARVGGMMTLVGAGTGAITALVAEAIVRILGH